MNNHQLSKGDRSHLVLLATENRSDLVDDVVEELESLQEVVPGTLRACGGSRDAKDNGCWWSNPHFDDRSILKHHKQRNPPAEGGLAGGLLRPKSEIPQ